MRATSLAIAVDSFEVREPGPAGASPSPRPRRRKPWTPDHNATIVYQWVKFEGKRQSWVASALRISQSTVSRIVERYEKWLAHGRAGAEGGLNEAERQRSQRWLTYERNEIILASCLRIAGDMEGRRDVSRSVVTRPMGEPMGETEVRTTHESIDRSGIAARFCGWRFRSTCSSSRSPRRSRCPPCRHSMKRSWHAKKRKPPWTPPTSSPSAKRSTSRRRFAGASMPKWSRHWRRKSRGGCR